MPEFGEFLSLIDKLRLGVQQHTPADLALMLRNAKYTQYDAQDITRLYFMLVDLIREVHADAGVREFEQAYTNPPHRKKFGLPLHDVVSLQPLAIAVQYRH